MATRAARHEEVAKLIVWCLLAGFSERLIPDLLTNFTQSAAQAARYAEPSQLLENQPD